MKLIKVNIDHYVIFDDSEIKEGHWYIDDTKTIRKSMTSDEDYWLLRKEYKKITHSTQPLDSKGYWGKVMPLTLTIFEIKELIGEVDVEKIAEEIYSEFPNNPKEHPEWHYNKDVHCYKKRKAFIKGYNQALEDNKEKKYTEEDIKYAIIFGYNKRTFDVEKIMNSQTDEEFIKSLQPKTEWEVEFVDGKLKLK